MAGFQLLYPDGLPPFLEFFFLGFSDAAVDAVRGA